jgi:deoxyadenosine/deoxycytidine kinase
MIITFEGGPASGKSTVASELENSYGCCTVPEVNKLFGKESRSSDLWYYQKQAERWQLALQNQESKRLSILDGDLFQPIWFSSLFPDENWGDFDAKVNFYSEMLQQGKVGFPNVYVYFHIEEHVRA